MLKILSPDDCHKLVKQTLDVSSYELIGFNLDPLDGKSGFMGEHAILHIRLICASRLTELRFFVKSLPDVESQKRFIHDSGAYFKEERMFLEIIPRFIKHGINLISECVPKCFLVQRSEVFVFEDLSARGYRMLNHRESYDLAQTKVALDAIVKLHASSLILEEKLSKARSDPYRLNMDYELEFHDTLYSQNESSFALMQAAKKGISTHIDLFPSPTSSLPQNEFKNLAQRQVEKLREFAEPSQRFRNVICHGDLWATNMMFRFNDEGEPVHCCLVDFQLYRYCPPAQDVLTFVYLTTDREFREAHLEDVLLYYYDQLSNVLLNNGIQIKEVVPHEEFRESCEIFKAFAVTQAVTHSETIMMSSEELFKFFALPGYSQKILYENRSELIVRLCRSDPVYRNKQHETICDLREICEELYQQKYK